MLKKYITPNARSAENMHFGAISFSHPIISWIFCDHPYSHEKILWPPAFSCIPYSEETDSPLTLIKVWTSRSNGWFSRNIPRSGLSAFYRSLSFIFTGCKQFQFQRGTGQLQPRPPIIFQKSWDFYTIGSVHLCSNCMLNLTCNFNLIIEIC